MPRRPFLATLPAVGIYLVSAWPTRASMVDDAYVSLRYARNLALGHGPVYNAGEPPVEGYTNFLWVLWNAPGTLLPIHPSAWATGWGLFFGALTLVCATGLGRVLCGRDSPWALLPAYLLAAQPTFAVATTNGLETALYLAALLGAAWAVLDGRRPALGGALAGLLYLVRPEGLAVAGVLAATAAYRERARGLRHALRPALAAASVVLPYFVLRTAYFGTLIPNTLAAQSREPFFEMFTMNAPYYRRSAALYAGAALLQVLGLVRGPRTAPRLGLLAAGAGLAIVAMRVYNWMPGARLFLPPIALVFAASAPMVAGLPRLARRIAVALLVAWTGWLALGPPRAVEVGYDGQHTVQPNNPAEQLARKVARTARPGTWLLARDAGVVPYFVGPDVKVIDIHPFSLTDPVLTGKPFDHDYLLGRDVAYLVTTSTTKEQLPTIYPQERALLRDARVADRFRQVATAKQHYRRLYALWVRDDVDWPDAAAPKP